MTKENELRERVSRLESRIEYLEEQRRYTLDILELGTTLGNFQTSMSRLSDPSVILETTARRVSRLLSLGAVAFYLVEEDDADFHPTYFSPENRREQVEAIVDSFIENGLFSWALKERKPVILRTQDGKHEVVFHVMSTMSRVRGMFVGVLTEEPSRIFDTSLSLLSILLLQASNALESYELYRWINCINEDLHKKVKALATSEEELTRHRDNLEELVEERTEKLNSTLQDKDALLKEVHHRVKNNLQIITSLMHLQFGSVSNEDTRELFRQSLNRVRTLALIYDHVHRSGNVGSLELDSYIARLARELQETYCMPQGVRYEFDITPVSLDIDRAVSCGLLFTELISNSLHHAFTGEEGGLITIGFSRQDDEYLLEVADTGVGLPEGTDFATVTSLGLRLVSILAEQISGKASIVPGPQGKGTSVQIIFPANPV